MKNVQANIENLNDMLTQTKNHYMCLEFVETDHHYMVIYPLGYFPDACRIEKGENKSKSLKKLINKMDEHWDDNYPV